MSPYRCAQVAALLMLFGQVAQAQEAGAPAPVAPTSSELFPAKAPSLRNWALTISPLHLALPVLEFTGERRLSNNLGVALMIGAGSLREKADGVGTVDNTFKLFELGASVRYYGLGNFAKGMQFGAALEFIRLTGDNINGTMISGIGSGLLVAPFIGYKHTWSFGLTFDGQVGPSYAAIRAKDEDGTVEEESNRLTAYLNLNLGYSF